MADEAWIDTVRLARDMGTVDQLVPAGCSGLMDLPVPIFNAIRVGMVYLSFDEMLEEDRPPRKIWQDAEKLSAWMSAVKHKRGGSDSSQDIEDPVQNEAAKGLVSRG